jgi:GT2 family glycosyltransferase
MSRLGIVAIGRNEGDRLRRCLHSVAGRGLPVVYVDGNSTDGSVELARSLGVEVIEEDPSRSNCAATARNEGFERLCQLAPDVGLVQFVDADCEVVEGWLDRGRQFLEDHPKVAVVVGRRRERFAEQSVYARLADMEWDMPIGEIDGSHGDMMIRASAFREIGGFDPQAFVGEDVDLCVRLRKKGFTLIRIDAEMTLHDIAMTRFRQWFLRSVRGGYGFTLLALLHPGTYGRPYVRHILSIIFWAIVLPLLSLGLAWRTRGASLLLLSAYPLQIVRIAWRESRAGMPPRNAWLYAWTCVVARFPHLLGLLRFGKECLQGRTKTTVRDF